MRKLKVIEHISLDGVVQTTSGADDDFPYGDWTAPYRSPAGLQVVVDLYGKNFDLLFGRRTYDLLANYWPKAPKSVFADRLNAATKYVLTHRPKDLPWGPVESIGTDLIESIRRIKAKPGPDILMPGSLSLIVPLLEHGLADEVILLVNPVVLGKGKRFFADGNLPRSFALGSSRAMPTGILVNIYKLIPSLAEEALSRAKLEREMEIAREVQERLFPQTFPKIPGVEMAAQCRPAHAVGGDYYDLISIHDSSHAASLAQAAANALGVSVSPGEGAASAGKTPSDCDRLGIAIGDISGKGISAALLMASLHASLRSQTLARAPGLGTGDRGTPDLAIKMANVNRLLYDASGSDRYATFFYAELDCHSRVLHYVNGGHNPPAVLRPASGDGKNATGEKNVTGEKNATRQWQVLRLGDGGPAVGLLPGAEYQQHSLQLLPGDIFLAFTDGISESMNAAQDEWGESRMLAEAQKHADAAPDARGTNVHAPDVQSNAVSANALLQHVFRAADAFADGAPQHDDMTLLVMRIAG